MASAERLWVPLLLGALQGATEWLPVSSEGVLTLVQVHLLGRAVGEAVAYALWLHLGSWLAVVVYFRRDLWALGRALPRWLLRRGTCPAEERALLDFLAVATAATGAVGLPLLALGLRLGVGSAAATGAVGLLLVATGLVQRAVPRYGARPVTTLRAWEAGLVGALQGMAVLPGLSRSGLTVAGLLLRRFPEAEAFRLSFLLSVPALGAAGVLPGVLRALGGGGGADASGPGPASWLALAAAFTVGWATLSALLGLARRPSFWRVTVALGLLALAGALAQALLG